MKRRSEFPWGVVLEQDHLFVTSVNQAVVKVYLARTGALLQQVQSPMNLAGLCWFGGSLLAMPYTSDEGTDRRCALLSKLDTWLQRFCRTNLALRTRGDCRPIKSCVFRPGPSLS